VARQNATTHGLHADPLVFLDNMPPDKRTAFDALVRKLALEEKAVGEADLMLVRDIILADLIAQRGLQYILNEWSTSYSAGGVPSLAQADALSQWAGYARLKATLRAALRQGTGERGDPGKVTDDARRRGEALARELAARGIDLDELERDATREAA